MNKTTMISIPQLELQHATTSRIAVVDNPKTVDVLCGRGKMCFRHEGNNRFRVLIAEHADTYKMAPTKKVKTQVIALVVEIVIARGGRFLVQNNDDCTWVDGGRKQGKKKTGHAFRDALRGRVKCITEMREANAQVLRNISDNSSHSTAYDRSEEFDLDNSYDSSHSTAYDRSEEFDLDNSYWLEISRMNPSMLEPSKDWMHSKVEKGIDLWHSSAYDTRSEEFDSDSSYWLDISRMNPSIHIKVDKEIANDLLKLLMAEQLGEALTDKCSSVS